MWYQAKQQRPAFSIKNQIGNAGVHRAKFLDQMVELLPQGIAQFGKRLESISQRENGLMHMTFMDGTTATADAILGCDGIKSRVRQIMFGDDHPCAHPTYTHKYAYRALVPMEDAVAAMGDEKAMNSCMHVSTRSVLRMILTQADFGRWVPADTCLRFQLTMDKS